MGVLFWEKREFLKERGGQVEQQVASLTGLNRQDEAQWIGQHDPLFPTNVLLVNGLSRATFLSNLIQITIYFCPCNYHKSIQQFLCKSMWLSTGINILCAEKSIHLLRHIFKKNSDQDCFCKFLQNSCSTHGHLLESGTMKSYDKIAPDWLFLQRRDSNSLELVSYWFPILTAYWNYLERAKKTKLISGPYPRGKESMGMGSSRAILMWSRGWKLPLLIKLSRWC